MTLLGLFGTSLIVGLSGAMTPGPMLTATIAQSMRRGWSAGPLMVLGHGLLEFVLILALVAGLAGYLTRPVVSTIISLVGGAFLLYLGCSMTRQAASGRMNLYGADESGSEPQGLHPVAAGVLISISNPYWILWWATVGLMYLTMSLQMGGSGLMVFFSGHITGDLLWFGLISGLVTGGRRFLNQRAYNYIIMICGLLLMTIGGYFIYQGLIK